MTDVPPRKTNRVPADHIESLLATTNLTVAQLASEFGVGRSTIAAWLTDNSAPRWTLIAVEGVRRRLNKPEKQPLILVTTTDRKHRETLLAIVESLGGELIGEK